MYVQLLFKVVYIYTELVSSFYGLAVACTVYMEMPPELSSKYSECMYVCVCVFLVVDFVACIMYLKNNQVSGNVVSTILVIQILVHVGHINFKHFPKLKIERQHEDILTLTRQFKEMLSMHMFLIQGSS